MRNYGIATLTIAGSDSSGGAGIQADLKTFAAIGTYGMSVITAITAQNTQGVFLVEDLSTEMVRRQIQVVLDDIPPQAIKVGMVSSADIIQAITETLAQYEVPYLVVDPVMISKSGCALLANEAKDALITKLMPRAFLVTPNIPEAEEITGMKITCIEDMKKAGQMIRSLGPQYVLIKGGHLIGDASDILIGEHGIEIYHNERLNKMNTHGTGCTLSSAITSYLALGCSVEEAVARGKQYITDAIRYSFAIGSGIGPVHHFYQFEGEKINGNS
ncbi:bifunctional hydroxymethylpyrimidine kinase/phosphomethylpyrimidine kinase [Bacillus massiliigorillae]|uniref:bifunctional hydroxymethylpyrimidine kinase/phosphomethylpyrimidine kinase n=1 Tax=Bacillus massiliigorillae TaxID=1243664 RepID=UPI0003A28555|nr:bifunctional hydroxymethylpyrimidine kinase/phosphomethylpyrimidine kinase [Bacillus massiliigorillae]